MNDRLKAINETTATPVSTRAGLSGHPDSLTNIGPVLVDGAGGAGETAYQASRVALRNMYDALAHMHDATQANLVPTPRGNRVAMEVPPDKRQALATAMGARFESAAKAVDRSVAAVKESLAALEKATESNLVNNRRNETSVAQAASEIRAYVKGLPDAGARMAFLHDQIKDGSHEVVAAVLQTTGWVSGLTPKEMEVVRGLAEHKFAPRETAQRDAARKALDTVMQAGSKFVADYHRMIPVIKPDAGSEAVRRLAGAAS